MPHPHRPDYKEWLAIAERFVPDDKTLIVAHSCGAGFVLRWLSEKHRSIKQLVLVAPWLDTKGKRGNFLDFVPSSSIQEKVENLSLVYSPADTVLGSAESINVLKKTFPNAHFYPLPEGDHFSKDELGTHQFSQLMEILFGYSHTYP